MGGDLVRRGAANLPRTATQSCTIPRQGLQCIATRLACKRDNLNRPAAKAAQGKLKKMTKVILVQTDEPCGCE
jgi:hypothetical protein